MNKVQFTKAILDARAFVIKNSPTALTGLALVGLASTAYLSYRAGLNARDKLEEEDLIKGTWQEKAKVTWKCFVAPAVMGTATAACIVGSNVISLKRAAALTGLYTISENALKEYQAKSIELIGPKKAESIREAVAKDRMERCEPDYIFQTGRGDDRCFDSHTGRYFWSDINVIREAVATLNLRLVSEMTVSLNDFYYEIGLDGIPKGDDVGWNIEMPLDCVYDAHLRSDGKPCLVIRFKNEPFSLYRDF